MALRRKLVERIRRETTVGGVARVLEIALEPSQHPTKSGEYLASQNVALDLSEGYQLASQEHQELIGKAIAALLLKWTNVISSPRDEAEANRTSESLLDLLLFLSMSRPRVRDIHDVLVSLLEEDDHSSLPIPWRARILSLLFEYESLVFVQPVRTLEFWRKQQGLLKSQFPGVIWAGMLAWGKENPESRGMRRALGELHQMATNELQARAILSVFPWAVAKMFADQANLRDELRRYNSSMPVAVRREFNRWFLNARFCPPWPELVSFEDMEILLSRLDREHACEVSKVFHENLGRRFSGYVEEAQALITREWRRKDVGPVPHSVNSYFVVAELQEHIENRIAVKERLCSNPPPMTPLIGSMEKPTTVTLGDILCIPASGRAAAEEGLL